MYEEYQRQEEENIKKGKKGFVSTISGLSAQPSGIKDGIELREPDENSQTESEKDHESVDNLLSERKRSEEHLKGTVMADKAVVDVHDLLVDIKAEKVEATEVKLEDLESESVEVSENGALVGMDSLLDNVYCAAVEKLNSNISGVFDDQNSCPLISLDDKKESTRNGNDFLFGKVTASMEAKLLPELSPVQPLVLPQERPVHTNTSEELGQLVHISSSDFDSLGPSILEKEEFQIQPLSRGSESTEVSFKTPPNSEANAACRGNSPTKTANATSDTVRPNDGQEKEKKIQTSTTQVGRKLDHNVFHCFDFSDKRCSPAALKLLAHLQALV